MPGKLKTLICKAKSPILKQNAKIMIEYWDNSACWLSLNRFYPSLQFSISKDQIAAMKQRESATLSQATELNTQSQDILNKNLQLHVSIDLENA